MKLSRAQKSIFQYFASSFVLSCIGVVACVEYAQSMQILVDQTVQNGEMTTAEGASYLPFIDFLTYMFPAAIVLALFLLNYIAIRGWHSRKNGPGIGQIDLVFQQAKQDAANAISLMATRKIVEEQAQTLDVSTPSANAQTPSRRL